MEENRIFPDNWKEVVRGKKVILYNTGVSGLLHEREKQLEKMKWVFQTFKEHPEVVLWWRPHPLELNTLRSMLPELEGQYKEVRRQYQEKNVGILDESADLNRAIAISDAYYGAWSSVTHLYQITGKPLLISNSTVVKEESGEKQGEIRLIAFDEYKLEEDSTFFKGESENYTLSGYVQAIVNYSADIRMIKIDLCGEKIYKDIVNSIGR